MCDFLSRVARQPLWPLAGRPALGVRPEPEDGAAIGAEAFAGASLSRRQSRWSSVGVRPHRFTLRAHRQGQTPGGGRPLAEPGRRYAVPPPIEGMGTLDSHR